MSFSSTGTFWLPAEFGTQIAPEPRPSWVKGITLHHTAAPSLEQRPDGFTAQHLKNMRDFYRGMGWSSGPHLFIDDHRIWGMTPMEETGVHARSFNRTHIGIEVLGDYDSEDPFSGRGLQCWKNAATAVAAIMQWMQKRDAFWSGRDAHMRVNFHRDDPKTSKTCPGRKITKDWFMGLLEDAMSAEQNTAPAVVHAMSVAPPEEFVNGAGWLSARGIIDQIRRRGSQLYVGPHRIERHFYDKTVEATFISERELKAAYPEAAA